MAISEAYSGTSSISAAWSLPNNAAYNAANVITVDGIYEAVIDFTNLAATESYNIKVYEKCRTGDSVAVVLDYSCSGIQNEPLFKLPLGLLLHGWDVVVTKLQGTARTINWSIRSVA